MLNTRDNSCGIHDDHSEMRIRKSHGLKYEVDNDHGKHTGEHIQDHRKAHESLSSPKPRTAKRIADHKHEDRGNDT